MNLRSRLDAGPTPEAKDSLKHDSNEFRRLGLAQLENLTEFVIVNRGSGANASHLCEAQAK